VLADDDVPKSPSNGGGADGARLDEGKTGAWLTASLVSMSDEEARPERARASSNPCAETIEEKVTR
jgi:hypothetical protein